MFIALLLAASSAFAHDRAALATDAAAWSADVADHSELTGIVARWSGAVAHYDFVAERDADAALFAWLRAERDEAEREVDRAQAEVTNAAREARGPGRDDDRDFRDDARDLARELQYRAELGRLTQALSALQPAFADGYATPMQRAQKAALLDELGRLADAELAANQAELREDRVESAEDRYRRGW